MHLHAGKSDRSKLLLIQSRFFMPPDLAISDMMTPIRLTGRRQRQGSLRTLGQSHQPGGGHSQERWLRIRLQRPPGLHHHLPFQRRHRPHSLRHAEAAQALQGLVINSTSIIDQTTGRAYPSSPYMFLNDTNNLLLSQKLGVHKLEELADSMGLQARGGRGEHSPPGERKSISGRRHCWRC